MGHNWKAIVDSNFPGRTALQARNQYNLICRRTAFDTRPSTPGSMQDLALPLPLERPLPHLKSSHDETVKPNLQGFPTDTDLEYEEWNNRSSEDEDEDDNDNDNTGWPKSEGLSHWDPASEYSHMQACQNSLHYNAVSSYDLGNLTSPLPNDGMGPLSSFDLINLGQPGFELGGLQTLQQASNPSLIADQVKIAPRTCE